MKKYIMGNEAIAGGALEAGVRLVAGYPGTPATEIVDGCLGGAKVYVEWSVNEKAALETAMGASLCGLRSLAVMKHNGTNFAADFIMHLNFTGVRGGMALISADDPGGNSSQNEEDTRVLLHTYAHLPVLDPASPGEAKEMIKEAFALSEEFGSCFVLRPVMRVCHSRAIIEQAPVAPGGQVAPDYRDDRSRFVMSAVSEPLAGGIMRPMWRHRLLNQKQAEFARYAEDSSFNAIEPAAGRVGLVGCGIGYTYVKEAETRLGRKFPVLKLGTLPLPKQKVLSFCRGLETVIVFEEIEPVVERLLKQICYEEGLTTRILGRESCLPGEGELTTETVLHALEKQGLAPAESVSAQPAVTVPVRTRTQCVGCPHRGLLSALKQAARGPRAVVSGDIGCYDAGSFPPMELQSTIFCMGSSIPVASGIAKAGLGRPVVAVIGDSTFFHNGLLGLINAVNNRSDLTVVLCDNGTTAMTGFQPHPGSGTNIYRDAIPALSPEKIGEALGLNVKVVNPYRMAETRAVLADAIEEAGVSLVISRAPCHLLNLRSRGNPFFTPRPLKTDPDKCSGCKVCLNDLGCPSLSYREEENKVYVDTNSCVQCGLCADICRRGAVAL